jgi:hypothetical protein
MINPGGEVTTFPVRVTYIILLFDTQNNFLYNSTIKKQLRGFVLIWNIAPGEMEKLFPYVKELINGKNGYNRR